MIVCTTDEIPGMKIVATYGIVRGNAIRARHVGNDIGAFFKGLVGGEIHQYTKLMGEVREQSIDRMTEDAKRMGANAVVATRLSTSMVLQGAAEMVAYGTAVRAEALEAQG